MRSLDVSLMSSAVFDEEQNNIILSVFLFIFIALLADEIYMLKTRL